MAGGDSEGFEILGGIGGDIKVWNKHTFKQKIGDVAEGGLYQGDTFIYPFWKTLLNKWFAYKKSKVYIVTPFLDDQRLEDICRIALVNLADDNLEKFFVRGTCNRRRSITDLQEIVSEKIMSDVGNKDIMRIKLDKIYRNIINTRKLFHAKFMCCIEGDDAEVFISSANFHANHFDCHNLETMNFIKTTKRNAEEKFLQPLTYSNFNSDHCDD